MIEGSFPVQRELERERRSSFFTIEEIGHLSSLDSVLI
jgi:hypothetical protein